MESAQKRAETAADRAKALKLKMAMFPDVDAEFAARVEQYIEAVKQDAAEDLHSA